MTAPPHRAVRLLCGEGILRQGRWRRGDTRPSRRPGLCGSTGVLPRCRIIDGPGGYNFRFPGQYYDAETGLHYNYFREYDPTTGRCAESDPIGLGGR